MRPPRVPARWHLAAIASILGALAALAVLVVAAVWLYDHRNAPVLVPVGIGYVLLDGVVHWTHFRHRAALREIAERASDDADRALSVQLAQADTDVIPAVVADLPRRPRPYPVDDVDRALERFSAADGRPLREDTA